MMMSHQSCLEIRCERLRTISGDSTFVTRANNIDDHIGSSRDAVLWGKGTRRCAWPRSSCIMTNATRTPSEAADPR